MDANTLFVQYDYDDGATGGVAKYVRLSDVIYPNGRDVQYNYNLGAQAAIDQIMSRLSSISDSGSATDAAYTYLGAGTIVTEDYVEAGVKLDYAMITSPASTASAGSPINFGSGMVTIQPCLTSTPTPTTVPGTAPAKRTSSRPIIRSMRRTPTTASIA